MARKWMGTPPAICDICQQKIHKIFIDGKTNFGPWGNMCPTCHKKHGGKLGTGLGQKYELQEDGSWAKTAG